MKLKILVRSYKRPGRVKSINLSNKIKIVIPESQYKDYLEYYPKNKLVVCPDKADGNLCRKRNWILENNRNCYLLQIDDDIKSIGYWEKGVEYKLGKKEFDRFVENSFRMCEEAKTILWGINVQTDKKFYREYSPFSFLKMVLGPFMGIINIDKDLICNEIIDLKEDYDMCLQVLLKYHKILRFNKFHYSAEHINTDGGCSTYRTMKKEMEHNKMLQKKWGSKVVDIGRKTQMGNKSINPIVRIPLKGI